MPGSQTGDRILVYLAAAAPVKLRLDRIASKQHVRATWIDPSGVQTLTPPTGWPDALLLLEAT